MATTTVTPAARTRRRGGLLQQEALYGYLFLLPWIIGFIVFVAGPMIGAFYLSLSRYSLGVKAPEFIGFANFARAFTQDQLFFPSILRTLQWAVSYVPLAIAGSLLTAVLLNQGLKGTTVFRTIFFMPHLTPVVASVFLWTWMLNPKYGFINEALWQVTYRLTGTGVEGPGWFGSKEWAMPALVLIALWGAIGGNQMLIFLAGLQGVPKELYEVAELDGANVAQRFWHVTLPMISPTIFFNLVLGIIGALQAFSVAFIGTGGGPAYATWFYALHIYATAFQFGEMGYASALAVIFFVVLVALTYLNFKLSTRWVHYAGEVK